MLSTSYRKFIYWFSDNGVKIFAVLLIGVLAFNDFLTMKNLFEALDLSDFMRLGEFKVYFLAESNIFAFSFALLLEGSPFFMGIAASQMADKTKYNVNDKINARCGFIISLITFIFTLATVVTLRLLIIFQNGGFNAFFENGNFGASQNASNSSFIVHVFLMILPLLTSMLAFGSSWIAFRSESIDKLEKKLEKMHGRYLVAQSKFLDMVHKNDDARMALWGSLTANDKMPTDLDTFRKECFDRIRAKLISNSVTEFPDQIERFNSEITGLLQEFIGEMGRSTTSLPRDIENMNVNEILDSYDERCIKNGRPADAWSYTVCGEELEDELTKVLDNAVVVAQFKTATKPFHKQGEF